ncbi:hypothetical protein GGS23DRAFT_165828 [Durotheca rogersii]|uniref:uncharacterized protein n=1 Tax=Durotheca rogersii TaxID=419775 RepID=UPI0022202DA6|nr:uncharacterized protein GGS23DRAFT_165828 [Durotheca rogersii]KAI5867196.1 hypothetical protein GGS23DRAFT_165828 [Durotheca rogersii]
MVSIRLRSDSRTRPSDESRPKRTGGVMEAPQQDFPPTTSRIARTETDSTRVGPSSAPQSKAQQSRIPQNVSTRKPSSQKPSSRPPLTHETQSWSSHPGRPMAKAPTSSATTSRGQNDSGQPPRSALPRKGSDRPQERPSLYTQPRSRSGRSDSSSSVPRSQTSVDTSAPYSDRGITASPVEMRTSQGLELPRTSTQPARLYPELDRYRDIDLHLPRNGAVIDVPFRLATEDLPPPTPIFSGGSSHSQLSTLSASPSTRFSESPGPGPYSRDTTPTSMSSQSPGLVAPFRVPISRVRQASPAETRPPVTRRRTGSIPNESEAFNADPHGLAAVREALNSSSSGSTVRAGEGKEKEKGARRGLSPAPLNPPPRKSSQKFRKDQSQNEPLSKAPPLPSRTIMRSPSPTKPEYPSRDRGQKTTPPTFTRPAPPSRPSRDGTPDLYYQLGGPIPVIQSNLSSTSLAERRHSSQLVSSSLLKTTSSAQERSVLTKAPVAREPTPAPRSAIPKTSQTNRAEGSSKPARTPSPVATSLKTRFPLFGRRTKTTPDVSQVEKKDKPARKGPAAGTGHEGYGRIGLVKRRSSSATNLPRGFSGPVPSSDSLASMQSTDPFLLERMNPVIIAGGEVVDNQNKSFELARTESNQSEYFPSRSGISRNSSFLSSSSRDEPRQTLLPSNIPRTSTQLRPSDGSDSEGISMKPTIAFRRSVQRLRSPNRAPLQLPKPIITAGMRLPSVESAGATIVTDDSVPDSRPEPVRERVQPKAAPRKLTKQARSPRKWNIFGRSQSQPSTDQKKKVEASVSAAVKPTSRKPVAFYTMMDSSEQDEAEDQDVCQVLREAEVLAPLTSADGRGQRPSVDDHPPEASQIRQAPPQRSSLELPRSTEHPPRSKDIPAATRQNITAKPAALAVPKGRPSRLPQVGRIPRVVNTRPEQTSPKSFSRPFSRISMQIQPLDLSRVDQDSVAKGPSPPMVTLPEPPQEVFSAPIGDSISPAEHNLHTGDLAVESRKEFLAFSPLKDSECTTSSSSCISELTDLPADVALLEMPTAPLSEDEIWDEYNDLLGEVPPSTTSSHGFPFPLETYQSKLVGGLSEPLESPTINTYHSIDVRDSIRTGRAATESSHYSADMTARINAAFGFTSDPPATRFPASESASGHNDRDKGSVNLQQAAPLVSTRRDSSSSSKSTKTRGSDSSHSSEHTPLSQVNLRVGSMTVSKWLTFGHVLFSPIREDLASDAHPLKRNSILVIDGLGNDDWSFYAAETYPDATFFNLSPRAPLPKEQQSAPSFPLSPPNHHQIQYGSQLDKLPFGPDSFTSVVFRFPSAAPESHYRNIISEARRVLKPGGYIELSILDSDLNNMGNRTRRAVRRLKEKVNARHPDFNLSSTADLVLRLLGRKGFVDMKSCRVGVPVASAVTKASGVKGKKDERSLAEMMNDKTETGDENITKMVSKVGRWWYNRCYEASTGINTSIWNDKSLLTECEEWGTSLKLLVCHARIPDAGGRVASI